MNPPLTVVLTLKGRYLHTLRWLIYANKISLPYHIIIADGEVNPSINRLLSTQSNFPNISYRYIKSEDIDISAFYAKWANAIRMVNTPYVMMSDNDDFLLPSGIDKAIDLLNSSPEYICSGGRVPGFSLKGDSSSPWHNVTGKIKSWSYRYAPNYLYECRNFDNNLCYQRVLEQLNKPLSVHYCIYRTNALQKITSELEQHSPSFLFCELYTMIRTMSLGKVHNNPRFLTYLRQQDSSSKLGYSDDDLLDCIINSSLALDFNRMVRTVAKESGEHDNIDPELLMEKFYAAYLQQLRVLLANRLLRYRFIRLYKLKLLSLKIKQKVTSLLSIFHNESDSQIILKRLHKDGATKISVDTQLLELERVASTIEDGKFESYIEENAPELISQ